MESPPLFSTLCAYLRQIASPSRSASSSLPSGSFTFLLVSFRFVKKACTPIPWKCEWSPAKRLPHTVAQVASDSSTLFAKSDLVPTGSAAISSEKVALPPPPPPAVDGPWGLASCFWWQLWAWMTARQSITRMFNAAKNSSRSSRRICSSTTEEGEDVVVCLPP